MTTTTSVGRQESATLDAASSATLKHGLGVKPDAVIVQECAPGQNATIVSVDAETYRVKFLWHDGKGFKVGTPVKFYVLFSVPETTTPPVEPPPVDPPTDPVVKYTTSEANGSWMTAAPDTQVNNNVWSGDGGPQTLTATAWNKWYVVSNQPGTGTDDGVKSYPDTQKHVKIPVSTMAALPSSWKVAVPAGGGTVPARGKQWNAAYDLWLGDTADSNWDTEVMVWTNWTANWKYWFNEYRGEYVTFDGVQYAAYHRPASADQAAGIWFIRQTVTNEGTVDLAKLLKWAQGKGWMPATSVLREIEYGFEVLYTGEPTKFELLDFTIG